jgi:hypothetical protein
MPLASPSAGKDAAASPPYFCDRLTIAKPHQPPPFFLDRSRSTHPPQSIFPGCGQLPPDHWSHPAPSTVPVRSTPLSPTFLAASWGSQSCQVSAPWAREACGVHLAEVWPLASHREPCLGTRSERARGRPGLLWATLPRPVPHCGRAAAGRVHAVHAS